MDQTIIPQALESMLNILVREEQTDTDGPQGMSGPCFEYLLRSDIVETLYTLARTDVSTIGLYRDVWIAAIASSRTRLATLSGAMCKMSQCELRSLRVNSGMFNVIRIVTYYTLPPLESPDSFWIAMAISR